MLLVPLDEKEAVRFERAVRAGNMALLESNADHRTLVVKEHYHTGLVRVKTPDGDVSWWREASSLP